MDGFLCDYLLMINISRRSMTARFREIISTLDQVDERRRPTDKDAVAIEPSLLNLGAPNIALVVDNYSKELHPISASERVLHSPGGWMGVISRCGLAAE